MNIEALSATFVGDLIQPDSACSVIGDRRAEGVFEMTAVAELTAARRRDLICSESMESSRFSVNTASALRDQEWPEGDPVPTAGGTG